jgi:hypothetical protein
MERSEAAEGAESEIIPSIHEGQTKKRPSPQRRAVRLRLKCLPRLALPSTVGCGSCERRLQSVRDDRLSDQDFS